MVVYAIALTALAIEQQSDRHNSNIDSTPHRQPKAHRESLRQSDRPNKCTTNQHSQRKTSRTATKQYTVLIYCIPR